MRKRRHPSACKKQESNCVKLLGVRCSARLDSLHGQELNSVELFYTNNFHMEGEKFRLCQFNCTFHSMENGQELHMIILGSTSLDRSS